jgi:membrane protease YdiL (CAAX protease family)
VAIGILVVWNVVANVAVSGAGSLAASAVGVGLLMFVALRAGADAADLGVERRSLRRGLRVGVTTSILVVAVVAALAAVPATRSAFADDRFLGVGSSEMLVETLVRIPFAPALTEEIAFRGVLLGLMLRWVSPWRAVLGSSVLFGLWHVLPGMDALETNSAVESVTGWAAVGAVAGQVVFTGVAGAGLAWLRLRAGSVVAPALTHWAVNGSAYLAGWLVVRNGWA